MRNFIFLVFIGLLITVSSCRSDFDFATSANGDLAFSKDTVYLDTVFRNIGSSTYTLKVYNKTDNNISIPTIRLGKGNDSKYRMTVDGMTGEDVDNSGYGDGKSFSNIELLAKDSLYIFIETTANITDANPTDFLYTDQIQFGGGTDFQKVELVTLIQDAYFIYPRRFDNGFYEGVPIAIDPTDNSVVAVYGRSLVHDHADNGDEYTFKTDKPYVVYGFASVPADETLTIPAGARVHFHADSGLIVQDGGTLNITGDYSPAGNDENEVIFEGDRLEPDYSDVPGQWDFVYLRPGSKADINHLTLKNATVGLLIDSNAGGAMKIRNTQIYDCSNVGILARAANIEGSNIVINSTGQFDLACTRGGTYNFTHCTFNNNWPGSNPEALLLQNYQEYSDAPTDFYPITANFNNCIIYGNNQVEMALDLKDDILPQYKFTNCLIRLNNINNQYTNNPYYNFANTDHYVDNKINTGSSATNDFVPDFLDVDKNQLIIGQDSAAKEAASPDFYVPLDLNNVQRPIPPAKADIGAYQSIL